MTDANLEDLRRLAISTDDEVVLASLAANDNEWVRLMVAVNKCTPNRVLAALCEDPNGWVREAAKIGLWLPPGA